MWSASARLQILPARWLKGPGRALSSFTRGRVSPRGPQKSIRRPEPIRRGNIPSRQPESSNPAVNDANVPNLNYDPSQNTLLSPVHIPEDPHGVLKETHPAMGILANSGLVVQRQLELMNVMIGFEQANKYVIMDANGNHIGYMAEQERGMANMMARQWFRTHRSFVTHVFDKHENEVLRFHRPFSWINSCIRVYDPLDVARNAASSSIALQNVQSGSLVQATGGSNARVSSLALDDMRVIGEAQQQWAPLRRKYNLFTYHHSQSPATDIGAVSRPLSQSGHANAQQIQSIQTTEGGQAMDKFSQFAYVDEPFLSWDFSLRSANNQLIGSVNRNFAGFGRELFTDTGVYALRLDSAALNSEQAPVQSDAVSGMTLDQRAVMLATAVSVDFDYFSRHSGTGGFGFMPIWFPGVGGEAVAGGAAAGEAGAVGGAAGGMAEGAAAGVAGAGAVAGYGAMSRGMMGGHPPQSGPPDQQEPPLDQQSPTSGQTGPYGDAWADEPQDPWAHDQEDPWMAEDAEEGDGDYEDWF
ncbi:Scramblase-domain-containing protein [Aspergillus coremiiformis]|uniref:Scramblase-domain-containing protein n=1 Tax=Aspergillus coremiiformis TaxID=138285 RepID=A0A5N6Z3T4_9EURO|nr:Scramblase-domain-containing protein [Aspergillus coremiiformis]